MEDVRREENREDVVILASYGEMRKGTDGCWEDLILIRLTKD